MSIDREPETGTPATAIACILVNYRSPLEMLERCLSSLLPPSAALRPNVIIVDNDSRDGVAQKIKTDFPEVTVVGLDSNRGFAAAVNRGLQEVTEPQVLLLNTDAVLAKGALELMSRKLYESPPDVAGIAPKMMSSSYAGIIDAIGTVMPPSGASFNRGIGQCDLGQYDRAEEVGGVCFGAALLRRRVFQPVSVGPLYEGYFLYFEDSDWCMRAFSQGYRFLTEPRAVVMHMHSGITRHESLGFKYRLIELNTLKIVTRNFESLWRTLYVVLSRSARLLARTFIRRKFVAANISTLISYAAALPGLVVDRRQLRKRRIVSDARLFRMASGEDAYFDTVNYRPQRGLESLIDSYLRLARTKTEPELPRKLASLYRMRDRQAEGQEPVLTKETAALFADEPSCVRELLSASTQPEESDR
jgi:hypothetical protein